MRLFKFALPILFAAGLLLLAARAWTDQADSAARRLRAAAAPGARRRLARAGRDAGVAVRE